MSFEISLSRFSPFLAVESNCRSSRLSCPVVLLEVNAAAASRALLYSCTTYDYETLTIDFCCYVC